MLRRIFLFISLILLASLPDVKGQGFVVPRFDLPDYIKPLKEAITSLGKYGTNGELLVETAKEYIGCKYGLGSRGPNRFDCSGFTGYVYEKHGIIIARSSREQYREGQKVNNNELKPGDLVFFARGKTPNGIYHVGMVVDSDGLGHFRFVHSAHTGVRIDSSEDPYYKRHYFAARRILVTD